MPFNSKIKGLTENIPFNAAGFILLRYKYHRLIKEINNYLNTGSVEDLHSMRISVRRLRYSLENFEICYPKKVFRKILEYLKYLQDLIGETRDLDILKEKVKNFSTENNLEIPENFYLSLDIRKSHAAQEIKLELMKFIQDKKVKDFFTKKM